MDDRRWSAVDAYLTSAVVKPDSALEAAMIANAAAGLPPIDVSAPQGKLLHLVARIGPRRRPAANPLRRGRSSTRSRRTMAFAPAGQAMLGKSILRNFRQRPPPVGRIMSSGESVQPCRRAILGQSSESQHDGEFGASPLCCGRRRVGHLLPEAFCA
jgi:hypothetical protein